MQNPTLQAMHVNWVIYFDELTNEKILHKILRSTPSLYISPPGDWEQLWTKSHAPLFHDNLHITNTYNQFMQ